MGIGRVSQYLELAFKDYLGASDSDLNQDSIVANWQWAGFFNIKSGTNLSRA